MLTFSTFTLLILSGYSTLFAASSIDFPLINEQQRQIFEKLQNVDTTIPSSKTIQIESNASIDRNDSVCFKTTSIVIKNMTLLNRDEQNLSIYPYIGRCNGIRSLSSLADSLTKQYIDKGYITSRVYLVPQDISGGTVELYALEGRLHTLSATILKLPVRL